MELNRSGLTIVEVLVAIVILTVGLLSVVGATGQMTLMQRAGDRMATAAFYAQDRMENLRAVGCTQASSGSDTLLNTYVMRWTVAGQVGGARAVLVEAEYVRASSAVSVDSFETWIPCQ